MCVCVCVCVCLYIWGYTFIVPQIIYYIADLPVTRLQLLIKKSDNIYFLFFFHVLFLFLRCTLIIYYIANLPVTRMRYIEYLQRIPTVNCATVDEWYS